MIKYEVFIMDVIDEEKVDVMQLYLCCCCIGKLFHVLACKRQVHNPDEHLYLLANDFKTSLPPPPLLQQKYSTTTAYLLI